MIIKLLSDLVYSIIWAATAAMNIPPLPEQVHIVLDQALSYIKPGAGILACFFDMEYLLSLFGIIIAVDVGILIYKLILWVLKKIPMAGVE